MFYLSVPVFLPQMNLDLLFEHNVIIEKMLNEMILCKSKQKELLELLLNSLESDDIEPILKFFIENKMG